MGQGLKNRQIGAHLYIAEAAVRLRITAAKRFKRVNSATATIGKLLQVAETTFRRLNAPELLPAVYVGAKYVDGLEQIVVHNPEVAARSHFHTY